MTATAERKGLTRAEVDRLEDERNELQNSFGGNAWTDGLIQRRLDYIDRVLAAGCYP